MRRRIAFLIIFSIAMGYLEATVVFYLRRLVPVEVWGKVKSYSEITALINGAGIMWSERTRELATILMLVAVAYLFGTRLRERWAAFLISFGIWDIFYYIFLYVWLRWPPGLFSRDVLKALMTWDVLFLIPVPWVSPVVVPVSISCIMILWGSILLSSRKP